jgi:hypothetical protein
VRESGREERYNDVQVYEMKQIDVILLWAARDADCAICLGAN